MRAMDMVFVQTFSHFTSFFNQFVNPIASPTSDGHTS